MNSKTIKNYLVVVSVMLNFLFVSLLFLNQSKADNLIAQIEEENTVLTKKLTEKSNQFDKSMDKLTEKNHEYQILSARSEAEKYISEQEKNNK